MMFKFLRYLFPILSVYAAIICTFWLCPTLPRLLSNEQLQFDYVGAIIGILSLLVTVLLGWNIYTVIDTKSEIEKLKEGKKQIKEYTNATQKLMIGLSNFTNGKYDTALSFLCSALVKINRLGDEGKEIEDDCIKNIESILQGYKDSLYGSYFLKATYKLIKNDFRRMEDKRIKNISQAIEDIISSQKK